MDLILNIGLAWVAMILAGLMAIIYILRVYNKKKKIEWVKKLNRSLRKHHKLFGFVLVLTGLVHGIFSSDKAIGFNLGTLTWLFSILLGASYIFRKRFKPQKLWIIYHRVMTVGFIISIAIHIIDIGGFLFDDILFAPKTDIVYTQSVLNTPTEDSSTMETAAPEAIITIEPSPPLTIVPTNTSTDAPTEAPTEAPTAEPTIKSMYIDGTYQATANGYRPGLTIELVIENDRIVSLKIIEHNEVNQRFWGYPVENVPQWIIDAQSTDVDIVSGATYTSRGIINATDIALAEALND